MSEELLRPLLPRYGLAPDTDMRLLNRSENETWIAGDLVLRLHRKGYHTSAEIDSELAWLGALSCDQGVRAVRTRPASDGSLLQSVSDRHVVGFDLIAGRELDPDEDLSDWFRHLGSLSARLHVHAQAWRLPPGFARKRWDHTTILGPAAHWGDWRDAPGLGIDGARLLERAADDLAERLKRYGTEPEVFGLIHADLRLANLLVDGAGLWVIDFDDCGFSWWMFDFAAAVSFIETDPRLGDLAAQWTDGYRQVKPLPRRAENMLPVMVLLRRMQLTAWLFTRAGSDTAAQFGGPAFAQGTVALAERYLSRGPAGLWGS